MKNIRILALELNNFKCHNHLRLEFDGENRSIYGDNATGKTSVYDALTWLLFGKDSRGNGEKNFDVKPLSADGTVRGHEAVTSVEVTLIVEEETQVIGADKSATLHKEMRLRRTLREVWSTKRGSTAAAFDGNTSEYFIDGVPMRKNEFDKRVDDLIPEARFRILTSVSNFASEIDWKERRNILFELAGTATDRQIMDASDEFRPLRDAVGDMKLDDFKKKVLAEKKALSGVRDTTPAKLESLSELETALSANDFAVAKDELTRLNEKKETILCSISSLRQNTALLAKEKELAEVNAEWERLRAENREFCARAQGKEPDTATPAQEVAQLRRQISTAEASAAKIRQRITACEEKIAQARAEWERVSAKEFAGKDCPTCGQPLPAAEMQRAQDAFNKSKQEQLDRICRTAEDFKDEQAYLVDLLQQEEGKRMAAQAELPKAEQVLAAAEQAAKEFHANVIPDMPGFAERNDAICSRRTGIDAGIARLKSEQGAIEAEFRANLNDVNGRICTANEIVAKEQTLNEVRGKIKKIREDAKNAAAELEKLESLLAALDAFTRYKISFVEGSINGMFRLANFRLFREQANGGIEDRCDVTYMGIPYQSLNNGAKINVGVDIINTLSAYYGVSVPLFIDNAESVTALEHSDMQTIRLVVSEFDKELRCE